MNQLKTPLLVAVFCLWIPCIAQEQVIDLSQEILSQPQTKPSANNDSAVPPISIKYGIYTIPKDVVQLLLLNPKSKHDAEAFQRARAISTGGFVAAAAGAILFVANVKSVPTGNKILKTDEKGVPVLDDHGLVYVDEQKLVLGQAGVAGLGIALAGSALGFILKSKATESLNSAYNHYLQSPWKASGSLDLKNPQIVLSYHF